MARVTRTVTDYTDDMTGLPVSEADVDGAFRFTIDGISFKMDTHSDTANEIRELLARAVANAEVDQIRPQAPASKAKRGNSERSRLLKKIRFWAKENDYQVADQGRISEDIVEAFRQSNPGIDMTPYYG
ncbi:histone-like nucleoid-structuring protein Lsr2 [Streptomyces sp. NPDC090442]|uniref:Lsr2 dimerization domain-containing protein n=1 Tax=Streptomyces sp. NPDC090442 TaxID=3365962 RepID=UPI003828F8AD